MSDGATPPVDTVEQFAADLRLLRVSAGSPTLASLQHSTGISRTVLSDAFTGKQLPSARTVDGIVRACKADPVEWLRRRDHLATKVIASEAAPKPVVRRQPKRVHWVVAVLIGLAAFALGAGTSNVVTTTAMQGQVNTLKKQLAAAGPVNPHAQIQVRSGVDPAMTPCVNDAKVSASEDRPHNTRIQIIWSNKCYAGWARIARYDGLEQGNEVKVSIYPETAPKGPDRQDATEPGVQGAYTTLIVRPSPQTRLCAVGSITVGSQTISLGDPICT
ncbi:DUF2690 domain-containing protein [Leifsonia sp. NPDC056665]|uniref:DUF2690 domain-containing protein n=1 Tax=Leifsonia sp. NPDC056665 TaxID=3345901 RepID=UPI00367CF70C